MTEEANNDKWGQHHLKAMGRQGLAELRAAMYADSNVAQQPGYGIFGNPTPQDIVKSGRPDRGEAAHEPSVIEERMGGPAIEPTQEQREPPEPERD